MIGKRILLYATLISAVILLLVTMVGPVAAQDPALTPIEQLGKSIFFDKQLSINNNQACSICHGPEAGWTGPTQNINKHGAVYEGSISKRFGNRKPPSAAYAGDSPPLSYDQDEGLWIGGMFWDGRATGAILGDPLAEQAQGPFLNPLEQALPDNACVVYEVCTANKYPVSFEAVWGDAACDIGWPDKVKQDCKKGELVELSAAEREKVNLAYDNIARSIAAYERSDEVNPFTSKYDAVMAGQAEFTEQEAMGLMLFMNEGDGGAKCAACHVPPLFTDFTYDNLGVPRNPENPFYEQTDFNPLGRDWVDEGLGGFLKAAGESPAVYEPELGKMKVPTLRNVDLRPNGNFVKAYGHNGYFKSLKGITHFYNTRDVKETCENPFTTEADALAQNCWPEPEVSENVNMAELGNLGLTPDEEAAIVAFMKTLSDGYQP